MTTTTVSPSYVGFERTVNAFDTLVGFLKSDEARTLTHAELETRVEAYGRDLLRQALQDHLTVRAYEESRLTDVVDADGVPHTTVERQQTRTLTTIFGDVKVDRLAYRHPGTTNLYPADAALNLPVEQYSHGLRQLAAIEAVQRSYDTSAEAIARITGQTVGKRQVEALVQRAAQDVETFYSATDRPAAPEATLVLSADGKGIVMRREGLRPATAKAAAAATPKLSARLSPGEKHGRKRMAEVVAVYDALPVPRTAEDILGPNRDAAVPGPRAEAKWLNASVVDNAASVIQTMFDEGERRDPNHERTWLALVDGNNDQLERIEMEAKTRQISLTIHIDFVHVLEYLWAAVWCFFAAGDPKAEAWVLEQGLAILQGRAATVAAAMRRKATVHQLSADKRKAVDRCADYLLRKKRYLDYPTALARGWPIATGIIEGACRHLVKDRFDITGARWGLAGAEAVLKLRAVWSNGDWAAYWAYHLAQEQQRIHAARYANGILPDVA